MHDSSVRLLRFLGRNRAGPEAGLIRRRWLRERGVIEVGDGEGLGAGWDA